MLKRCIPILRLYAKYNLLDKFFFDNMWKIANEKHEAISTQIQNILCELGRSLKKNERDYIYDKILNLPKNKFDLETLNFAKNFSRDCIILLNREKKASYQAVSSSDSINNDYGVNLMIKFAMDEVENEKNDLSIIDAAIGNTKDLFTHIIFNDDIINSYIFEMKEKIKNV